VGADASKYCSTNGSQASCDGCHRIFQDDPHSVKAEQISAATKALVDLEVIRQMIEDMLKQPGGEELVQEFLELNPEVHPVSLVA
jgi:hypothetical protein